MWKSLKLKTSLLYHPVTIFLAIQVIWVVLMVSWIGWYVERYQQLQEISERLRTQVSVEGLGWLPLIVGGILLALILAGSTVIFIFWNKQHRLNQMQRNFVANITHELKSPLASIQLALETMALRKLPDDLRSEYMGMMLADSERLSTLIDRILGAARIDRRRDRYAFEAMSMKRFIEEVLDSDRRLFEKEGHRIVFECDRDCTAKIDRPSMQVAISNMIENATRYSPRGSTVQLRLHRDLRRCRLDVIDSGSGIERKNFKNVFKLFWRGEHAQSFRTRGTGLGLFIVRNIVRDHGGKIWVTSPGLGRGSTFRVRLPRFPRSWREARSLARERARAVAEGAGETS